MLGHFTSSDRAKVAAGFQLSRCLKCEEVAVWSGSQLVYPVTTLAPEPNPDMPAGVLDLYREAADVSARSPRAAAALLRLSIEALCRSLDCTGRLDAMIGQLVQRGLPATVQMALDVVRVTGNDAVHEPGVLLDDESRVTVSALFELVNQIVDYLITQPQRTAAIYASLPEGKKQSIERRDRGTSAEAPPGT